VSIPSRVFHTQRHRARWTRETFAASLLVRRKDDGGAPATGRQFDGGLLAACAHQESNALSLPTLSSVCFRVAPRMIGVIKRARSDRGVI
jgi:hypothetical protein